MPDLNAKALLLDDTEVKIALTTTQSGRGYVHVRVALGLSRWCGVLPVGPIDAADGLKTSATGQSESD